MFVNSTIDNWQSFETTHESTYDWMINQMQRTYSQHVLPWPITNKIPILNEHNTKIERFTH